MGARFSKILTTAAEDAIAEIGGIAPSAGEEPVDEAKLMEEAEEAYASLLAYVQSERAKKGMSPFKETKHYDKGGLIGWHGDSTP